MDLGVKYKPSNQKLLFNKKCILKIKNWIKTIEENNQQVLSISGPSGCGKKTMINILFKTYNIIYIQQDDLKITDNRMDIYNNLYNYKTKNMTSYIKSKDEKKGNIICFYNEKDNEKIINSFIEYVYIKLNIKIPIIILSSEKEYKSIKSTYINLEKPSYQDLLNLINMINSKENLNLSRDDMKYVITKSLHDINQIYHILHHYRDVKKTIIDKNESFNIINMNISNKDVDIDMNMKMNILLKSPYNFNNYDILTETDSSSISLNIYQNIYNIYTPSKSNKEELVDLLEISKIMDTLCYSSKNIILFDDICDEKYSHILTCVKPIYLLNRKKSYNDLIQDINSNGYQLETYKNRSSYNMIEYKNGILQTIMNMYNGMVKLYVIDFSTSLNKYINDLSIYIDKIVDNQELLTNFIFNYVLFESNKDINKIKYKESEL